MFRVRVGKRGVVVIPKEVREKLGITEGMFLELEIRGDEVVLKARDLWSELRRRGKGLKVDLEEAEREITEDDEAWLKRQRD